MARTRKSILPLNLYKYDVLIEDNRTRSEYFRVTQFDGFFQGGRNGFLLAGASVLRPGSKILIEILNKDGTTVYSAPVSSFVEGNSRLVQVEVYEDTPFGPGKIVVLGCADTYLDGTPIPEEWQGKYNVRWITDVVISPRVENKTPIRFLVTPSMVVTEKFYPSPATASFSQSISLPLDVRISPKYYNIFPNGYQIILSGTGNSVYTSDYLGGVITGSIQFLGTAGPETASIQLPLTRIYNDTIADSVGSLIYTDVSKTLVTEGYLSSSGQYIGTIQPFENIPITSSINLVYNKLITVDTGSVYSYANIRIVDTEPISGEVHQVRLSYKPSTDPGDYVLLANIPTKVQELLATDSASKVINLGKFTQINIPTYWYAATMSLEKNAVNITVPTYYNSSSLTTNLSVIQSSTDLLDAVHTDVPITNNGYQSASYFIGTTTDATTLLFPRTEYTLAFDAFVSRTSASIELTQSDYSLEVYLVPQENSSAKLLTDNPRGQLLGVLTPTTTFKKQNFDRVEFNFTPEIIESSQFGLRFVVYGGFWNIANVSLKPAEEPFFSPDEVNVLIPVLDYSNTVLSFKAEFLDVNNNSSGISVLSTPIFFTGSGNRTDGGGTVGPGTSASLALFNTVNTVSSSVIYQSSGKVGIGTSSPLNTLQIQGNVSASSYTSSFNNAVGFFGTSSWAQSSSVAFEATIAKAVGIVSSSTVITSTQYTGSFTGSLTGSVLGIAELSTVVITPTDINPYTITSADVNKKLLVNSSLGSRVLLPETTGIITGSIFKIENLNGEIVYFNQTASVDTTFSSSVSYVEDGYWDLYSIATQSDGKILIGGYFTKVNDVARTSSARLNTDGTLDTAFGNLNLLQTSSNFIGYVYALNVQSDGKILLGGYFDVISGSQRNNIARLNSDGTLDTGFQDTYANNGILTITSQSDGKIVIGGDFTNVSGSTRNRVARLNNDGTLDTSFDSDVNNRVYSTKLQSDGKILIGGDFTTVSGSTRNRIARLNTDGTLDTGFDPNANSSVYDIVTQPNGKILIGGIFTTVSGSARNRIARLNSDGTLDTEFDPNANSDVYGIAVQPNGKIVIGGYFTTVSGSSRSKIALLNDNGTLDQLFLISGSGGPTLSGDAYVWKLLTSASSIFAIGYDLLRFDNVQVNYGVTKFNATEYNLVTVPSASNELSIVSSIPGFATTKLKKITVNQNGIFGSSWLITETNVKY